MPVGVSNINKCFWSHIDMNGENGCWNWLLPPNTKRKGHEYGRIRYCGKRYLTHRFSFVLANNEHFTHDDIEGCCICHSCNNTKCVNPAHLYVATDDDNNKQRVEDNRSAPTHGECSGSAKLTEKDVLEIRKLYAGGGYTYENLGDIYGVTYYNIYCIIKRKSWKHI